MSYGSVLLSVAREAASLVMEIYQRPFEVDYKGPDDPVTEADRAANEHICRRLETLYPGVPIVAEESDPELFSSYVNADRILFVDPVDGTKEFVDKNGEFVVMIGMVVDQAAVSGVVVAPAWNRAWVADVGLGAFEIDGDGPKRRIAPSALDDPKLARVVASRSHRTKALQKSLSMLQVLEVQALGSAGLKGAWVASGQADAYVAPGYAGKLWDSCAIDALVTASGGRLTDAWGHAIDYRSELSNHRGLLATNGLLHDVILQELHRLRST